jgi:signal transduction histidine kinase
VTFVSVAVAAAPGVERANRFIVILLGLQRLSYLLPALLTLGGAYRLGGLNTALVVLTIAGNVAMFVAVARDGWFTEWMVWADVGWATMLTIVVSANSGIGHDDSSVNWSGRMAQAAAALAGAAIPRIAWAAFAVGLLLLAHVWADVLAGEPWLACLGCLNGIAWFAIIIGFAVRYLRRQGSLVDRLTAERIAAQAKQAAAQARLEHFRVLHDTVLATLTVIGRGGLEQNPEQVRERCAREADLVRRLMSVDRAAGAETLTERLSEVVEDAQALGLTVHLQFDSVPDIKEDVAKAVAGAAQEALNNVLLHSGTPRAWVTATTVGEALSVRIVDRGAGFEVDGVTGSGLAQSVTERMRLAGGDVRVSSAPGDGTCVELVWPR